MIHCKCNYFPGVLEWGDMGDLAGLCAPKPLVIISGKDDPIFPVEQAKDEFRRTEKIYQAGNADGMCRHVISNGGHRYYKADAWNEMNKFL
jgi:hypothetical protein